VQIAGKSYGLKDKRKPGQTKPTGAAKDEPRS
jgi:hypothetical protein